MDLTQGDREMPASPPPAPSERSERLQGEARSGHVALTPEQVGVLRKALEFYTGSMIVSDYGDRARTALDVLTIDAAPIPSPPAEAPLVVLTRAEADGIRRALHSLAVAPYSAKGQADHALALIANARPLPAPSAEASVERLREALVRARGEHVLDYAYPILENAIEAYLDAFGAAEGGER